MAKEDSVASPAKAQTPSDGKYEVVLPVGLPDEGTFEWLDGFLAANPKYTELSDRSIVAWAEQSGLHRSYANSFKHCNDKPDVKFGIPMMDDFSVRRVLNSVVATQPRDYVVMEVKSNLIAAERGDLLKRFNFPFYKKVAQVTMGEPDKEFKAKVHEAMLKEKQEQAEREWRARKLEKERKKLFEAQQKQLEDAKIRRRRRPRRQLRLRSLRRPRKRSRRRRPRRKPRRGMSRRNRWNQRARRRRRTGPPGTAARARRRRPRRKRKRRSRVKALRRRRPRRRGRRRRKRRRRNPPRWRRS